MDPFTLKLPPPPSTNALYSGRRFKTASYKAWINEAGWELKMQHWQPVKGAFELLVQLPGRGDLDNLKAVPDLLVSMGVIPDDRRKFMRRLTIEPTWGPCTVTITPLVG